MPTFRAHTGKNRTHVAGALIAPGQASRTKSGGSGSKSRAVGVRGGRGSSPTFRTGGLSQGFGSVDDRPSGQQQTARSRVAGPSSPGEGGTEPRELAPPPAPAQQGFTSSTTSATPGANQVASFGPRSAVLESGRGAFKADHGTSV